MNFWPLTEPEIEIYELPTWDLPGFRDTSKPRTVPQTGRRFRNRTR